MAEIDEKDPIAGAESTQDNAPESSFSAAEAAAELKASTAPKGIKTPAIVGIAVVALVVGCLIGRFLLGGIGGGSLGGKTTLSEGELDTAVASYTFNGATKNVSAREVIQNASSLESAKNDDGSYNVPSAESTVSFIRNQILNDAAASEGISVSDDDVNSYAQETLGSSDVDTIAQQYGMDSDTVKQVLKQSAGVKKLYDKVTGGDNNNQSATTPEAPVEPENGNKDEKNATYGQYIINLIGDEWDSANNTWARTDGPFHAALSAETFSADSASYNQAQMAYYAAQSQSQSGSDSSDTQQKWTDYVNGKLSNTVCTVFSLVS